MYVYIYIYIHIMIYMYISYCQFIAEIIGPAPVRANVRSSGEADEFSRGSYSYLQRDIIRGGWMILEVEMLLEQAYYLENM